MTTPDPEIAIGLTAEMTELARLRQWVSDLQSGMYVNCVYCGHRYGPGETTPVSMADALKAHIEQCPQNPMSVLRAEVEALRKDAERYRRWRKWSQTDPPEDDPTLDKMLEAVEDGLSEKDYAARIDSIIDEIPIVEVQHG